MCSSDLKRKNQDFVHISLKIVIRSFPVLQFLRFFLVLISHIVDISHVLYIFSIPDFFSFTTK